MKRVLEGIGFIAFIVGAATIGTAEVMPPVMLFGGLSIIILMDWEKRK